MHTAEAPTTVTTTAAMGVTPGSSALAHIPLITTSATAPMPPPALIPAAPAIAGTSHTPTLPKIPASIPSTATSADALFSTEGTCPLPDQLRKKILNLEYVDMAELRPESWLFHSDTDSAAPLQGLFQRCKEPVTDLAV